MTKLNNKLSINDISPLLQLAIPLILTGLLESASPFFGTIFLAQLGQGELAAGALVRSLFFALMAVIWGILTAVSGLAALKHGEKNIRAVSQILRDGILLSVLLTIPAVLVLWYAAPIFLLFGQNQVVVELSQDYLRALAWGVLPDFMTLVLLQFVIGLGHARLSLIFTFMWVPVAIFFKLCIYLWQIGFTKIRYCRYRLGAHSKLLDYRYRAYYLFSKK